MLLAVGKLNIFRMEFAIAPWSFSSDLRVEHEIQKESEGHLHFENRLPFQENGKRDSKSCHCFY